MKQNKPLCIGLLALAGWLGLQTAAGAEESETVVPVHIGKVVQTSLHGYEAAYGRVQSPPTARVAVSAAADGIVGQVACRPGQTVKQGDLLIQLDARVVKLAVNERRQALEFAQKEFSRQQQLLKIEGTSQKEYQQAARDFHQAEQALTTAQVQLDYFSIRAPMPGIITSVATAPGATVQVAQPLATLLDPTRRIVSVQVPADAMGRLHEKQPVQVSAGEDWLAAGTVNYIAAEVNEGSGTVEVRTTLPADAPWKVGQFIQARILFETHSDCLAVPVDALVTDPDGKTYIAAINGDRAQRLPVVGKLREAGWIEVEGEGLTEGMTIATEGAYGLPEATRVKVIGR